MSHHDKLGQMRSSAAAWSRLTEPKLLQGAYELQSLIYSPAVLLTWRAEKVVRLL